MYSNMNDTQLKVIPYLDDKIRQMLSMYMQRHSKVFFVRADIHYPVEYQLVNDNIHIQRCMAKTIQFFQRKGYDPMYMWVREQNMSIHPHYHCIFLLNGHKTRSAGLVFDTLTRLWASTIGSCSPGLIHFCFNSMDNSLYENGQILHRANGVPANVSRAMDYLAKPVGKGERKDGLRDFGMSRLPHNPQPQNIF